jgi:hypothetical protein
VRPCASRRGLLGFMAAAASALTGGAIANIATVGMLRDRNQDRIRFRRPGQPRLRGNRQYRAALAEGPAPVILATRGSAPENVDRAAGGRRCGRARGGSPR